MFDQDRFMEHGLTEGAKHFRRLDVALKRGESPPPETLQFLADAGRAIANGENPKKALKLEKKKGNKMDGLRVCRRIILVKLVCRLMDDFHLTKAEAIYKIASLLADKPGHSLDSIERHYDTYHVLARESNRVEKPFANLFSPLETLFAPMETPKI